MEWSGIVGYTPWLATQDHMSEEDLRQFYDEPAPDVLSELEEATKDVWHCTIEDMAGQDQGKPWLPVGPRKSNHRIHRGHNLHSQLNPSRPLNHLLNLKNDHTSSNQAPNGLRCPVIVLVWGKWSCTGPQLNRMTVLQLGLILLM